MLLFVVLPMTTIAQQTDAGINFKNFENWGKVLAQAKKENKDIFIDAFATWCGPCKKMDMEVYPNSAIGKLINEKFISVKVQFDQTEKDPDQIKKWYSDAKMIMERYQIESFPTYLFVNPDGKLNYKAEGYQNAEDFTKTVLVAKDPQKNYTGQIQQFKSGKVSGNALLKLALLAKKYHDDNTAMAVARKYKATVLDKENPEKVLSPELAEYIGSFYILLSTKDEVVKYMYSNQSKSDSLLKNKGFSKSVVDYAIITDLIDSEIKDDTSYTKEAPDWNRIERKITNTYDQNTSKRLIVAAKIRWYNANKDWQSVVKYNLEELESRGIDTLGMASSGLNNMCYEVIFKYATDTISLNKGIALMEMILKNHPDADSWLDTYANLLYKTNRIKEALQHEQRALEIAEKRSDPHRMAEYKEVLYKMRNNQPTWPVNVVSPTSNTQKPLITDTTYKNWTSVGYDGKLSNDGKFVYYTLQNKPIGGHTLYILSTDKNWEKQYADYDNVNFTEDSRFLFAMQKDTLIRLKLKTNEALFTPKCKGYELLHTDKGDWLIYQLDDSLNTVTIQNLKTSAKIILLHTEGYILNKKSSVIISKSTYDSSFQETLQWTDLLSEKSITIYKGTPSLAHIFDPSGTSMVFITKNNEYQEIWCYKKNDTVSKLVLSDNAVGIIEDHKIDVSDVWVFSRDGKHLFFAQTQAAQPLESKIDDPIIWNYNDAYLPPHYKRLRNGLDLQKGRNLTVLDIENKKLKQVLTGNAVALGSSFTGDSSSFLLAETAYKNAGDVSLNSQASYALYNIETGEFTYILKDCKTPLPFIELSPDHKYVLYFNKESSEYFSYNIQSKKTEILKIKEPLYQYDFKTKGLVDYYHNGFLGWISNTNHVLVQGTYDIFEIDLDNSDATINLTKNIGSNNNVIFSLTDKTENNIVHRSEVLMVSGFNLLTKEYSLNKLDLIKRTIKQIYRTNSFIEHPYETGVKIKKAKNSESYLLRLENASASPNYFYTSNFKKIIPISNNYPEKKYNWVTAELIKYKAVNGEEYEGVLYKPENFDQSKRYPVIFNIYLDQSNKLHEYNNPGPAYVGDNILLLVSNGYLFFKPNVYQIESKPGQSALTSVMAGADHLSKFPWIDSTKMGISGHSLGGFETNYIISHTNRFSAALSMAGVSNFIECYNSLWQNLGQTVQSYVKSGGFNMRFGLEQIPEAYIQNSPVLYSKEINTPVLLMHNEGDLNVPVDQSMQLFIQLRSIQKPVWLLQYPNEIHVLTKESHRIDFQKKVMGFFDYYLKNAPKPEWMDTNLGYY
jgi:dipeptidyl aminopeptidase/acylaminoacyl peptidase/thiol-disulfide isomerase/thioredoxin